MNKENIKTLLIEQNITTTKKNIVPRELTPKVEQSIRHSIAIISGIRRSGKSTLLNILRTKYEHIYVNFDDERFIRFSVEDFQTLLELAIELFGEQEIFFFDEIQNITGWERFIRRLHDNDKKIFITGSNASMLSKELGTHLTGRHIQHELYPFSFKEYLNYKKINGVINRLTTTEKAIIKRNFNEYQIIGGIPKYVQEKDEEYLRSLYINIIYRDIITRYNIQNEKALKETIHLCTSNIGKEISYNKIRKSVQLTSTTTIKEYLTYAENSYLLFQLTKYDHSIKKQLYANKKIYCIDTGLANIVAFRTSEDKGRILENIVFIQLKRQRKEIYYHKEKKECDFVIFEKGRIIEAIQVCYELHQDNKKREYSGLIEAMKKHKLKKGLILTYDQEEEIILENKKIIIKPVWKWLLEK